MELKNGSVVRSIKGRDKNRLMCVIDVCEDRIMVCDGKERPLERAKAKNPKHIVSVEKELLPEHLGSNKAIKKALKIISEA
ncbi:MAG: KOW domain-containing RNA-binding protein [Oscillospiraceae bacterium]